MSSEDPVMRYTRARTRKRMLEVDLNAAPPGESRGQEGTSNPNRAQNHRQATPAGDAVLPAPIDLEALDDDVVISSPRAFAEAKNNARMNRGAVVVDVEAEDRSRRNKRRRVPANQTIINCDLYINLEGGNSNSMRSSGQKAKSPPPPPPPPKESTFSCPVCMGPLVEEMSTKCGHIFCKACIKGAIAAQSKCPTCRRKTTVKDLLRIYLPATRST